MARAKSSMLLVGLLLVLLPTLAILQYRWIGEVSAAERDRMESSLRVASDRFVSDFDNELTRLSSAFQIRDGVPENASPIVERYQSWSESSPNAKLIRNIYLLKLTPNAERSFFKVDLKSRDLQPVPLPDDLQNIRDRFRGGPGAFNLPASGESIFLISGIFRAGRPFAGPRPDDFRQRGPRPPRDDFGPGPPPGPPPGGGGPGGPRGRGGPETRGDRGGPPGERGGFGDRRGRGNRGFGDPGPSGPPPQGGPGGAEGATIIELDRDVIIKEIAPGLAERHFLSHDETAFRVALVTGAEQKQVLYSSGGEWKPEDIATADHSVNLFGPPNPGGGGANRRGGGRGRAPGPNPRGVFQGAVIGQPWQLVVKHRAGSLERAVDQVRYRNLAISFGMLLVLGASLISVVVSSQRARTLGRLQMEFAAGISHELRTPLAVIRSAAHNLRSGVVSDKEGVEQYAAIVQDEARRLSDMVDHVLLYSETQSGRKKYNLATVDLNEIVDRALTNLSPTIDFEKCDMTVNIDPELPAVKADASAMTQCLQNLLSNAFKYGRNGDKNEIEIAAKKSGSDEIQLSVRDHGNGVDPADQRHLFEPFYRGHKVESNVPGNGLGLHLVKRIMQAQGGRVTFSAPPEGGACFTLHVPIADLKK